MALHMIDFEHISDYFFTGRTPKSIQFLKDIGSTKANKAKAIIEDEGFNGKFTSRPNCIS